MTQVLDSVHLGAERSGETAAPIALALKDAIEMLATAKTAIDQMTEMLQYFTRLGGSAVASISIASFKASAIGAAVSPDLSAPK